MFPLGGGEAPPLWRGGGGLLAAGGKATYTWLLSKPNELDRSLQVGLSQTLKFVVSYRPTDTHADLQTYGCGCQNRFGIPFWLVGEFTTHFRTNFSGGWAVHWGYGLLTHGHRTVNTCT